VYKFSTFVLKKTTFVVIVNIGFRRRRRSIIASVSWLVLRDITADKPYAPHMTSLRSVLTRLQRDTDAGIGGTHESRVAMRMVERLDRCGIPVARMERSPIGSSIRELMTMPLRCGSRACESCGDKLRDRARERLERGAQSPAGEPIPWRSMITLTMSDRGQDGERAWSSMSGWISRWLAARKKWVQRNRPWMLDFAQSYAWVIEPTQRGWPHVHILMASPLGSAEAEEQYRLWAVQAWADITGCVVSPARARKRDGRLHGIGVDIQPIDSATAASKYLSLYLSKSRFDLWHYVVMGKRRIWSTSRDVPSVTRESAGWRMERIVDADQDPWSSPDEYARLADGGWVLVWESLDSGVTRWYRPAWEPDACPWLDSLISETPSGQ